MTDNNDGKSDKELDSLLNSGFEQTKPKSKQAHKSTPTSDPSIDQLLNNINTSGKSKPENVSQPEKQGVHASLEDVMRDSTINSLSQKVEKNTPKATQQSDLTQLIDKNLQANQNSNMSHVTTHDVKNIGSNTQDAANDLYSDKPHGNVTSAATRIKSTWIWGIVVGVVVTTALVTMQFQHQNPLKNVQSDLQSILKALVDDIENYKKQNGALPDSLTVLSSFPRSAVSWPIEHWKLRNTLGKIEVIWVPQKDFSYAVIIRDSTDAWVYDFSGRISSISN